MSYTRAMVEELLPGVWDSQCAYGMTPQLAPPPNMPKAQSDKASSAHLRKGLAHLELGEKAQAIVQLQFVVHEYPTSDEAKSARQRLRSLGSDSR